MIDSHEHKPEPSGSGLKIALLALAAAGVAAGLLLRATAPDPEALPPAAAQVPVLETYRLEALPFQPRTSITGLLEARREVEIFAETAGRVTQVGADEFDGVSADQVLVRMDPLLAKVAVNRAEAAVARAQSLGLLARAQLKRNQGLAEVNVSSRAALDEAENSARQARAARLESDAALAEARDWVNKTVISAPFGGILRDFSVEAGEYLRPGERVAELLDVNALRIRIALTDRQIVALVPGVEAELQVDARPGELFRGRVVAVSGSADARSRKFPVLVEIDNSEKRLMPGMVARVTLNLGDRRSLMALPLDAVLAEFGLSYAFVVVSDGEGGWQTQKRRIETRPIAFRPTEIEVSAGLAEGELIALSSIRQLEDGMAVRPLDDESPGTHVTRKNAQ
ncbi:MAG: efflux RND transporter periplasmic adaptor subunit [Myxococcota bacterium]|jgi:membrane fusion protein, multidrug efflux system|nr:efflux RND transporter periplasmic adaptor subunit [Myxococcota bacterium]